MAIAKKVKGNNTNVALEQKIESAVGDVLTNDLKTESDSWKKWDDAEAKHQLIEQVTIYMKEIGDRLEDGADFKVSG